MQTTIIDADRGTPLAMALDPSAMAGVFGRHLTTSTATVVDCVVTRFRHRPGQRCLVQYAVRVRDGAGREHCERITAQWHHEAGYTGRLHRRLARRAARETPRWQRPFAPAFCDTDCGMLATTFPWDRRLEGLPAVTSGVDALTHPMLAWMGAAPDRLEHVAVEPVRYREQLNAVCRYTVRARYPGGAWHTAVFYAKVYRTNEDGLAAFARLAALARGTNAGVGTARVPVPVAYVDTLRTLVLPAAAGMSLDHRRLDVASVTADLDLVAASLASFATSVVDWPPGLPTASPGPDRSCRVLAAALPERASALAALGSRSGDRARVRVGTTHGDLKLEHVFLDRGVVSLIDVDSAHHGDPVWDLALLQARWWAACDTHETTRPLGNRGVERLAAIYLARVPASWAPRLARRRVEAWLDVAAGIIKRCEPEAAARATRLVDAALAMADSRS